LYSCRGLWLCRAFPTGAVRAFDQDNGKNQTQIPMMTISPLGTIACTLREGYKTLLDTEAATWTQTVYSSAPSKNNNNA
jgi:hypothetical protein